MARLVEGVNFWIDTFADHLGRARAIMRSVLLDTPEKQETEAALLRLAECWDELGAEHGPAKAFFAAGVQLKAAVDAVPTLPLLELMEHLSPVPWRPDGAEAGSAGAHREEQALGDRTTASWEGDDYDELEPLVRRLLAYMSQRERGDLADLEPSCLGRDYADLSESAPRDCYEQGQPLFAKASVAPSPCKGPRRAVPPVGVK